MGDVINLNRFRKKKAKVEKEKRAETNRRLHGRNKAERVSEDALKKRIEEKMNGAFLVRESVAMEDIPVGDLPGDFERLEAAVRSALAIEELSSTNKHSPGESTSASKPATLSDANLIHSPDSFDDEPG